MVLPSLFEEQLTLEAREVARLLEAGAGSLSAALALDLDLETLEVTPPPGALYLRGAAAAAALDRDPLLTAARAGKVPAVRTFP